MWCIIDNLLFDTSVNYIQLFERDITKQANEKYALSTTSSDVDDLHDEHGTTADITAQQHEIAPLPTYPWAELIDTMNDTMKDTMDTVNQNMLDLKETISIGI